MPVQIRGVRVTRRRVVSVACGYVAAVAALAALLFALSGAHAARTGVSRRVYAAIGFSGTPVLSDASPAVSIDFLEDHPDLPRRFFSARWHGFWYVPETVEIDLFGAGDDRLDVWIDDELRIRRTPPADMHTQVQSLRLDAGVHELRVEYEQHGGASNLYLAWAPRGARPRPIPPHRLFREMPVADDIRLARQVEWLKGVVFLASGVPVVFAVGFLMRRLWEARARLASGSQGDRAWERGWRIASVVVTSAIAVRAVWARLPGWNPESLWNDDLVYAAIIRADLWSMLTAPIHVAPGLFVIWRGFYELFPDPEWSLQILPFACAFAAIPVMYHVVHRLTADRGLGLLAAAVTALNPLLAQYTVFVHQYPFDFLVTALFLLAAVTLFDDTSRVDPRRFAKVALAAGIAPLFSVPSVFVSFPIMHVGALGALRDWRLNRSRALRVLGATAAYDLAVLACYVLLRNRTNDIIRGGRFADGFMPLDSLSGAGSFLATNGQQLLEMGQSEVWLPFIGLGCIWLLARRPWRALGLVVVGFYAAFLLASALKVYPLGTGRPDIFAFPVSILLLASGAHLATASLPAVRLFRFAFAALVVTVVLVWPPPADYRGTPRNDHRLIEVLAANERPDDGVIMTWTAGFLTAFYGQWPFELTAYDRVPIGTQVKINRTNTLQLQRLRRDGAEVRPGEATPGQLVRRFLQTFSGRRVWFMEMATPAASEVTETLERSGYAVEEMLKTSRGTLFLAVRRTAQAPPTGDRNRTPGRQAAPRPKL